MHLSQQLPAAAKEEEDEEVATLLTNHPIEIVVNTRTGEMTNADKFKYDVSEHVAQASAKRKEKPRPDRTPTFSEDGTKIANTKIPRAGPLMLPRTRFDRVTN